MEQRDHHILVYRVRGAFQAPAENEEHTLRLFDFLIQSHALNLVVPVPLPAGMDRKTGEAASWCLSLFGNMAQIATAHPLEHVIPTSPMRTSSMLHIAVARQDVGTLEACLDRGFPVDLRGPGGATPMHWVAHQDSILVAEQLLASGANVDPRDGVQQTPLMWAGERPNYEIMSWLIEHGAEVNAVDERGATALHRVAELGNDDLVRALLSAGADHSVRALGHTPRSIADYCGHTGVVRILSDAGATE